MGDSRFYFTKEDVKRLEEQAICLGCRVQQRGVRDECQMQRAAKR